MKYFLQYLILFWLILWGTLLNAQNIVGAEFYWDLDLGFGSGTSISISQPDMLLTLVVPITTSGLNQGIHHLFIRTRDAQGNWSLAINKIYFIDNTTKVPLTNAEYYWDSDPGFGLGTLISISQPDSLITLNVPIPTSELSPGVHHLFIRIIDAQGNWSMPIKKLYYIDKSSQAPLSNAEYFWNKDPGFGNGNQITFNPSDVNVEQILSVEAPDTMSTGIQQLYLRLRDSIGAWSIYLSDIVYVGDSIFVDENAVGSNSGGSWTHAFTDLQTALHVAPRGSIILIAEGNYTPDQGSDSRDSSFHLGPNLHIVGGFPSGGASSPDPALYSTILSGEIGMPSLSTDNSYHVIISENVGDDVRVENITISDGYLNGGTRNYGGGGWYNRATTGISSPKLTKCQFKNNYAQYHGGGFATLAWVNGTADPILKNCQFENNTADDGGAFSSFVNSNGTVDSKLENCLFENNTAMDHGGAIYHHTNINSTHEQVNCVFYDNFAAQGGAVSHDVSPNGDYINCSFAKNRSSLHGGHLDADQITDDLEILLVNCILGDEHPSSSGPYVTTNTDKVLIKYSLTSMPLNSWIQNGGNNIVNQDPLFFDELLGNLRVSANSKAVNRGLNSANETVLDPDQNLRIKHGQIDMGAYEVQNDFCNGSFVLVGENCHNPYLWGETIDVLYQSVTGPGLFDILYNDSIYTQLSSGSIIESILAGTDIIGSPPFIHTINLDSIFDFNASCIPNRGPNIDTEDIQITDTIVTQLIAGPKDDVHCIGDTIDYTVNMTGGSGDYRYRFFLDKNMNGVRNAGELLKQGNTMLSTQSWSYIVQQQFNIIGVEILDKVTNCNLDLKFDTTRVDTISPVLLCQDITVALESDGMTAITPSDINNGSFDNCGFNYLSLNQNTFYCSQEGDNLVTLTGEDWSGNIAACQATVVVNDDNSFCELNCSNQVTTTAEYGYGSLKHVISCAQANDTIYFFYPIFFKDTFLIELDSITFKKNISIFGVEGQYIIIDASKVSTFARINPGVNVWIRQLDIICPAQAPAQVFDNAGYLNIRNLIFYQHDSGDSGVTIKNMGDLDMPNDVLILNKE